MMIDISELNKAEVLAELYNNARPQGLGYLHADKKPMDIQEAQTLLDNSTRFDYLKGRVLKVNLSGDFFRPGLYDIDNGEGAAQRVIDNIIDRLTEPL